MLSNFDLERLANFYHLPLVAVEMKDELPSKVKDGCYIINLQSSTVGQVHIGLVFSFIKTSPTFSIRSVVLHQ